MTFRDKEKLRLTLLKSHLFSSEACDPGIYRNQARDFCLREDRAEENLHESLRNEALRYFRERDIRWHHGVDDGPSNHICCSQCCCVNFWMPFKNAPDRLAMVVRGLDYDVAEMLPFSFDNSSRGDGGCYVAFEWIGGRNYLMEHAHGKVARDSQRKRGAGFTSADFAFRFRRSDGRIQIVLGEWKYTENYSCTFRRFTGKGTDRLEIYRPALEVAGCQIALNGRSPEVLFFDPFDQLMRLQLLCSAMECHREMEADIVSLLHVAPTANRLLMKSVTSPGLRSIGSNIHKVWGELVMPERFTGLHLEDVLPMVCRYAPEPEWSSWMEQRYGAMR